MLEPLNDDEFNPVRLWAEIWKLRSEARGPDNHETWRDAAIVEKRKRIQAEQQLAELKLKIQAVLV